MRSRVEMVNGGRGGDRIGIGLLFCRAVSYLCDGVYIEEQCCAWASGRFVCDGVVFAPCQGVLALRYQMVVVGGGESFVQMFVGYVLEGLDVNAVALDSMEEFSDRCLRL